MPYKSTKDINPSKRKGMTSHGSEIYKSAFNAALKKYGDEATAHKVANSAVTKPGERKKKQESVMLNEGKGKYEIIYVDDEVTIVKLLDYEASLYFGSGTHWDTAARAERGKWFNMYNDRGSSLYVCLPKDPIRSGEKYQFYTKPYLFIANEKDQVISQSDFAERFPGAAAEFFMGGVTESKFMKIVSEL